METSSKRSNSKKLSDKLRSTVIVMIACICGWFVMELEILGVRVLAPYFGSAVYVTMGSVIGVFLLSLAAGYMLGGRLSRWNRCRQILGINLMIAGLWLITVPFVIEIVCDGIFNLMLDVKWGSLLASMILFGVPTLMLGTVSPIVVRWLTKMASHSGMHAGTVLALSTLASFAGCIVTAFYLVLFSVKKTIWTSGSILLIMGLTIILYSSIYKKDSDPTKADQ